MRVFITGVVGFLGSHIAEHLISQGHDVIGIDNLAGGETTNIPAGSQMIHLMERKQKILQEPLRIRADDNVLRQMAG